MRGVRFHIILVFIFFASIASASIPARGPSGSYLVPQNDHPGILQIFVDGSRCTAGLIGPKTFITAAHCFSSKHDGYIFFQGRKISFKAYITPEYNREDLVIGKFKDVAIGVLEQEIPATPFTISWTQLESKKIITYGYGCSSDLLSVYFLSEQLKNVYHRVYIGNQEQLKALCLGDSGGPAFAYVDDKLRLVGVNKATNSMDKSLITQLSRTYVYELVLKVQEIENVKICGVDLDCD